MCSRVNKIRFIQVFINNKNSGFTIPFVESQIIKVIGSLKNVEIGDFNNDGTIDIMTIGQPGFASILYNKSINNNLLHVKQAHRAHAFLINRIGLEYILYYFDYFYLKYLVVYIHLYTFVQVKRTTT